MADRSSTSSRLSTTSDSTAHSTFSAPDSSFTDLSSHSGSSTRHDTFQRWSWKVLMLVIAVTISLPVMLVIRAWWLDSDGVWEHLVETKLAHYIQNSLILASGVLIGSLLIGVSTAWLLTAYQFPGRKFLSWALLLPMAMPAYVAAYAYTDLAEFAGPLQTLLRDITGWERGDYWFPQIRSLPGAVIVMSLVLYPYVYLTTRAAFLCQSSSLFESARSLGAGAWRRFWSVAIPMARPAIAGGASLAVMESLTDYGTVDYFAIDTFTTGIYRTWDGLYSYEAACQLAAVMLITVAVLLSLERLSRGKRQFHRVGQRQQRQQPDRLSGSRGWLATVWCSLPIIGGFAIPCAVLLAHGQWHMSALEQMWIPAWNSLQLALIAAGFAVFCALLLAYGQRLYPLHSPHSPHSPLSKHSHWLPTISLRIASLGYAIPGSVVAVAIINPAAWIDNEVLSPVAHTLTGASPQLWISGTMAILIFAYVVRFLAVALSSIEPTLKSITPSHEAAARSLGHGPQASLRRLHLPLMRTGILTAMLLVIVDVLKELPATMILRPFNFQTLAVAVHDQVSQESLALAALPALAIVLVGLGPVCLLTRSIARDLAISLGHRRSLKAHNAHSLLNLAHQNLMHPLIRRSNHQPHQPHQPHHLH